MASCGHTQHCFQKALGSGMDQLGLLLPKTLPQPHLIWQKVVNRLMTLQPRSAPEIGELVVGGHHDHRK